MDIVVGKSTTSVPFGEANYLDSRLIHARVHSFAPSSSALSFLWCYTTIHHRGYSKVKGRISKVKIRLQFGKELVKERQNQ